MGKVVVKKLSSLGGLMATLACVGLVCLNKVVTFDYWTHLALADQYLKQKSIFFSEPFLAPLAGKPLDNTEWLFQLLLVGVRSLTSDVGVSLFIALVAVCTAWILTRALPKYMAAKMADDMPNELPDGRRTLGLVLIMGTFLASRGRYGPRPETVCYLLMCASLLMAHRFTLRPCARYLLGIMAVIALWYPMHVTWSLGAGFVLLVLALGFKRTAWSRLLDDRLGKVVAVFFAVGAAASIAVVANFGWHVVQGLGAQGRMTFISEMRPLWEFPTVAATHGAMGLVAALLAWGAPRGRWQRLAFWALALALGLLAARNYAMSVLLMSSVALVGLGSMPPIRVPLFLRTQHLLVLAGALAAITLAATAKSPQMGVGISEGITAAEAATFVKENALPEPVFNSFDIGGALNYNWQGAPKTHIDGRSLGGEQHISNFRAVMEGQNSTSLLRDLGTKTFVSKALFRNSGRIYPVLPLLFTDPQWRLVNASDALVFVRSDSLGKVKPLHNDEGWDFIGRETAQLAKLESDVPFLPYNLAIVELMKRNRDGARSLFQAAVKQEPQLAGAHSFFMKMAGINNGER